MASDDKRKLLLLNQENILLWTELKDLNTNLTWFIDVIKDYKISWLGGHFLKYYKEVPEEIKMIHRDGARINNQKLINNLETEAAQQFQRL